MNPYTNHCADAVSFAVNLLLSNNILGDSIEMDKQMLTYSSSDKRIISAPMTDTAYPELIDSIRTALLARPANDRNKGLLFDDLHELITAMAKVELLRFDIDVFLLTDISEYGPTLFISLKQGGEMVFQDRLYLNGQQQIHARIIIRHYTRIARALCCTQSCLLSEAAEVLDEEHYRDLINRIRKHLQVRAD